MPQFKNKRILEMLQKKKLEKFKIPLFIPKDCRKKKTIRDLSEEQEKLFEIWKTNNGNQLKKIP